MREDAAVEAIVMKDDTPVGIITDRGSAARVAAQAGAGSPVRQATSLIILKFRRPGRNSRSDAW